jgi:NADH-quinone oxidoreductase subunit H
MKLGWKVLIPISLLWIAVVATVRAVSNEVTFDRMTVIVWGGGALAVLLVLSIGWDFLAGRRAEEELAEEPSEFDAFAGGHPVPPLPGQRDQVSVSVGPVTGDDREQLDA